MTIFPQKPKRVRQRQAAIACQNRRDGFCGCGRPLLARGDRCEVCAPLKAVRVRRRKRTVVRDRISAGLCTVCAAPSGGKTRCSECQQRETARETAARDARVASGICGKCGKNPLSTKTMCEACAERSRAYHAKRRVR